MKLYCCCLVDKPRRYGDQGGIGTQVLAGAASHNHNLRHSLIDQGWLMDDEGENMSALNSIWGDLTVLYWAWKQAKDEPWGVCQYRRKWSDGELVNARRDCIYVTHPLQLIEGSVRRQYDLHHGIFPAYEISMSLANAGKLPLSVEQLQYAWDQDILYAYNMARGNAKLMNILCELIFETMDAIWQSSREQCEALQGYQRRSIAFTAERLMTAILLHSSFFFGEHCVHPATVEFIE